MGLVFLDGAGAWTAWCDGMRPAWLARLPLSNARHGLGINMRVCATD